MPHSAAATALHPQASGPGIPNINPGTGLSTDYLNHFTEALMALEMAADVPECLDDLRAWTPKTYAEHFAQSRFTQRSSAIRQYERADRALRREVDRTSDAINELLTEARAAVIGGGEITVIAGHAAATIRPLINDLAALINGEEPADQPGSQAAIDAMFGR